MEALRNMAREKLKAKRSRNNAPDTFEAYWPLFQEVLKTKIGRKLKQAMDQFIIEYKKDALPPGEMMHMLLEFYNSNSVRLLEPQLSVFESEGTRKFRTWAFEKYLFLEIQAVAFRPEAAQDTQLTECITRLRTAGVQPKHLGTVFSRTYFFYCLCVGLSLSLD